jgi:hypothetical protein
MRFDLMEIADKTTAQGVDKALPGVICTPLHISSAAPFYSESSHPLAPFSRHLNPLGRLSRLLVTNVPSIQSRDRADARADFSSPTPCVPSIGTHTSAQNVKWCDQRKKNYLTHTQVVSFDSIRIDTRPLVLSSPHDRKELSRPLVGFRRTTQVLKIHFLLTSTVVPLKH